jgi:hypothetical protein
MPRCLDNGRFFACLESMTLFHTITCTIHKTSERFQRWEVIQRGHRECRGLSMPWTSLLALSALISLCLAGCAQEYEGNTSYSSFNCKESIQGEGSRYPFYPVLMSKAISPVFICGTGTDEKYCSHAEVSPNGECIRLYTYWRVIEKKRR